MGPGGYLMHDYSSSSDGYEEYLRGGDYERETPTWLFIVVIYAFFVGVPIAIALIICPNNNV